MREAAPNSYSVAYTNKAMQPAPYSIFLTFSSKPEEPAMTRKALSQMSAIDRLKYIQAKFAQTWKGVDARYIGKPGKLNLVNRLKVLLR